MAHIVKFKSAAWANEQKLNNKNQIPWNMQIEMSFICGNETWLIINSQISLWLISIQLTKSNDLTASELPIFVAKINAELLNIMNNSIWNKARKLDEIKHLEILWKIKMKTDAQFGSMELRDRRWFKHVRFPFPAANINGV